MSKRERKIHPPLESLFPGSERRRVHDHLQLRQRMDGNGGESPSVYLEDRLPRWVNGVYDRAKSYLPAGKTHFLDLETRGVGYRDQIWCIGVAFWDNGFVFEQFVARNPLEARNILEAYVAFASRRPSVVSFNGRTFDLPRLDYHADSIAGLKVPRDKHVDVYKGVFEQLRREGIVKSAKLQRLEQTCFKFKRVRDVDGSQIPGVYRRFVSGGDPEPVAEALLHNRRDLATLAALYLMVLEKGL